jgi:hypothetical protein
MRLRVRKAKWALPMVRVHKVHRRKAERSMSGTSVVPCRQPPEGGRRLGFLPRGVLHPLNGSLQPARPSPKSKFRWKLRTAILAKEFRQPGSWGKLSVTP